MHTIDICIKYCEFRQLVQCDNMHLPPFASCLGLHVPCLTRANQSGRVEASCALSADGQCVLVGCHDACLYALSVHDGKIVWQYKTGAEVKGAVGVDPATGLVVVGSYDKTVYALIPPLPAAATTTAAAQSAAAIPAAAAVAVAANITDMNNCRRSGNGGGSRWQTAGKQSVGVPVLAWQFHCGGGVFAAPSIDSVRRVVYIACTTGTLWCLALDGGGGSGSGAPGAKCGGSSRSSSSTSKHDSRIVWCFEAPGIVRQMLQQ